MVTKTKTQGERLAVIETEISQIKNDIADIKLSLNTHIAWEETKYDILKKDFAGRWVEKGFWLVIAAILGIALKITFGG